MLKRNGIHMYKMNKKCEKKKHRFLKVQLIMLIILLGGLIVSLGVSWVQNRVLIKEREEFYLANKEYIKVDKTPMTYIVMLDNSLSMKNNFKNMDQQLIDCLMVYQSILKENDKLVVFPLNWDTDEYIEICGKDDFGIGQSKLKNIPLFIREENETIELWTQRVMEYVNQLEKTEVRILVVTDKTEIELSPLEDIELRRDSVRVITTRLKLHFGYKENDKLRIAKVLDANDFIFAIFNNEFYMNYHGFFLYEFNEGASFDIQLPEKTDAITFLISGDDASLKYMDSMDSESDKESIEGNILTDSRCLYRYRSPQSVENLTFFLGGTGNIIILYPTFNGDELEFSMINSFPTEVKYGLVGVVLLWLVVDSFVIFYERKKKRKKK